MKQRQCKHSMFTSCDNDSVCQDKAKVSQGPTEEIGFQTSIFILPSSFCALPERHSSTHDFLSDPHTKGIQVSVWKGAVVCPGWDTNGWKSHFWDLPWHSYYMCSSSLILRLPKVTCLVVDRKN